jgi:competence protein ComEC
MSLRENPFFRLLFPFVIGTGAGCFADRMFQPLSWIVLTGLALLPVLAWAKYKRSDRWVFGAFVFVFLLIFGYYNAARHNELRDPAHFSTQVDTIRYFVGTIYDVPSKGAKVKIPLRVEAAGANADSLRPCRGHVLLFMDIRPEHERYGYGDRVLIRGSVRPTAPPGNPHAFDYRRYLHFQNIHFQSFVKEDSMRLLSSHNGGLVWRIAFAGRAHLLALLHEHFPTQDEFAVASALLIGYKDDLSDDLQTAYAETGSMHALAVSGTHVGMLYAGLLFLIQRLRLRGQKGRLLETLLILAGIWAFTFVTGATASVLRASIMFSMYLFGKTMFRNASIWNILSASAFGLLLYNPYFLFDAGFQLSYSAVAGMVFFYPRFYKMSPIFPGWADALWKVLLIGFAAQLGTLPLTLYYFHQFPVYFWLAGWIVVLGGAIFLAGGAGLAVLDAFWADGAHWTGVILYHMVWGMNRIIVFIQHLPGSLISGIWMTIWGVLLLYVAIGLYGAYLAYKNKRLAMGALGVLALVATLGSVRRLSQFGRQKFTVYQVSKRSLIDFFDGEQVISLSDSLTPKQTLFAAQPNRFASGMRGLATFYFNPDSTFLRPNFLYEPPFIGFSHKKIVLIDRALSYEASTPVPVDFLILAKNPKIELAACMRQFPFRKVIFDASNTPKQVERWKKECQAAGWACHDVRTQGFFEEEW